jgi:hypothetical protein
MRDYIVLSTYEQVNIVYELIKIFNGCEWISERMN